MMQAPNVVEHLDQLKNQFTTLHTRKEDLFWQAMMGLADDPSQTRKALAEAEIEYNRFMQSPEQLSRIRQLANQVNDDKHRKVLKGWEATFKAHAIEDPAAQALSREIVEMESALAEARQAFKVGLIDPETGDFEPASSVKLRLIMRTADSEARRKAAYEGLLAIERFVLDHDFLAIVKKRNQLGRMLGYDDYYDWRTSVVEGMRKTEIFDLLDALAQKTAERSRESLSEFQKTHGAAALEPWNFEYLRTGNLARKTDPYFPFRAALRRWGQSFQALGIRFRGARLTLDLVDREGKYENGFMHGPEAAFFDDGEWRPARINFTANAVPGTVGSGRSAIRTLFHEGGHAAHFSNIQADAPCFSHEFAPTSVAYAETQSMFLDSFLEDADWQRKYARNQDGERIPQELIEETIAEKQPLRGWDIRAMLTVPLAERAIYEIPEDELTPEKVLETVREIERETQGLSGGTRPILAVPHLLAGESSAYYHGYIMAEMAVYQTREFFLARDGYLTDNPRIGPELAEHYWAPGNAVSFNETLQSLCGESLSPDALARSCNASVEERVEAARKTLAAQEERGGLDAVDSVDLNAEIVVVHGREEVASTENSSFEKACEDFEAWVDRLEDAAN